MKNIILVTGGCGYIGSHTVIKLIENDFDVIIADDLSNSTIKTIDRIENITKVRPVFINIDFKEKDKVNALFQDFHKIAAVIHFAAHKAVGESVQNPLMYYQNNLTGLINLLVCAQKHHVKIHLYPFHQVHQKLQKLGVMKTGLQLITFPLFIFPKNYSNF